MSRSERPGQVCVPLAGELAQGDRGLTRHSPPSAEMPQGPRCMMFPAKGRPSEHGREEATPWPTSLQMRCKEKPGSVENRDRPQSPFSPDRGPRSHSLQAEPTLGALCSHHGSHRIKSARGTDPEMSQLKQLWEDTRRPEEAGPNGRHKRAHCGTQTISKRTI